MQQDSNDSQISVSLSDPSDSQIYDINNQEYNEEEIQKKYNEIVKRQNSFLKKIVFDFQLSDARQYENKLIDEKRKLKNLQLEKQQIKQRIQTLKLENLKLKANLEGKRKAQNQIQKVLGSLYNFSDDEVKNIINIQKIDVKVKSPRDQQIKIRDDALQDLKYYFQKQIQREKQLIESKKKQYEKLQKQQESFDKLIKDKKEQEKKRYAQLKQKAQSDLIANQIDYIKKLEKKIKKYQLKMNKGNSVF